MEDAPPDTPEALPPDAPPDAPPPDVPPDSCIPTITQLLINPLFDEMPQGKGWTEQKINASYPLITAQDGPGEHTAPFKAWLGGFTGNNVTDVLYQDVVVPPLTKELVLAGQHGVRTDEPTSTTAYDTATVALTQTNGTPIATVKSLSNVAPLPTVWTAFNHTFTQNLSGQTVRLRITSTNDPAYTTSFYFDTLALTATHGCP